MAADGEFKAPTKEHTQSYGLFLTMLKWGTILTAITTVIVVLIIAA